MTEREWMGIETAPKDGTVVLVWSPRFWRTEWLEFGGATVAKWANGGWTAVVAGHGVYDDSDFMGEEDLPTHWMPLPEPPSELQKEKEK